jgi:hypothetical protein
LLASLASSRNLRPSLRHCARLPRARRAIAAQRLEAISEIDLIAAEPALGENDGDLGGKLGRTDGCRIDHHAREPRRQWQLAQFSPLLGDASRAIDRTELAEQRLGLRQRRRRRRIEKGERSGIGDAPMRQVEHEAGEIGGEDFRPVGGLERRGLRLVP